MTEKNDNSEVRIEKLLKSPARRRILQTTAGLGLVGTGVVSGAQSKEEAETESASSESFTLTNQYLRLPMGDDGRFGLRDADDEYLLYPNNSTSYLSIRVDGETYVNRYGGMSEYLTQGPNQESSTESKTVWDLPELTIERNISLDGEAARITLTVRNDDSTAHVADVRYLLDYQVKNQDGAPIFYNGEVYTSERSFESPSVSSYFTYDRIPDPTLTGERTIDEQTSRIDLVHWPSAYGADYEYTTDPNQQFYTEGETSSPESDSASLTYWELGELSDGEERTITTYYGVGSPEQTAINDLKRSLENFRGTVTSLLSTTVQQRALAQARLYSEAGDEYADKLVDYLGYEAGVDGIDAEDVDQEVFDKLGTLSEEMAQPEAENLYPFFEEMFGAVSPEDSVDSIQSTFVEYLRGTAAGQENELLINDRTISELESRFVDDFESRCNEAIRRLREEDPTEDTIRNLINLVASKTEALQTRETELEGNVTEITDAILNGNGSLRVLGGQVRNESSAAVQTEAGGVALLGFGIYKAGAAAGAGKVIAGIGSTKVLAGGGTTAGIAGISAKYSAGSIPQRVRPWVMQSWTYWSRLTTWANSGPSSREIIRSIFVDKALEEFGLSPSEVIEGYTGIELELMFGLDDLVITSVEYVLDNAIEVADEVGQEIVITDLEAPGIDAEDIEDGVATETATLTVENRSENPVIPRLLPGKTEIRAAGIGSVRLPFSSVGSSVVPAEEIQTIPAGGQDTIELEFSLPLEDGGPRLVGLYELRAAVEPSPFCLESGTDIEGDNFPFTGIDLPDIQSEEVVRNRINNGESATETSTTGSGTERSVFGMSYGGSDLDLHLYDQQGNHVGRNYQTGEYENEIAGASSTGPDGAGESYEAVRVDEPGGDYEVEVVALEADGTRFSVQSNEISNLNPTLEVAPGEVQIRSTGGTAVHTISVEEALDAGSLTNVTLTADDLTRVGTDEAISAENIDTSRDGFDVPSGGTESLTLSVEVPEDLELGVYEGTLSVEADESSTEVRVAVTMLPTLGYYASGNGRIETEGLRDAVADWRQGNTDTDLLRETVRYWRNRETVPE